MSTCHRSFAEATERACPGAGRRPALLLLFCLQLAVVGRASAFSDVVFFGDSLSDTGNTCAAVSGAGGGFAAGRCSNGPVWADFLVEGLGLGSEATSSAAGGSNYANGGARSFDLAVQITGYTSAGPLDPDALHVIWLGGNDVLFEAILAPSGPGAMQSAAERIGAGVEQLAAAGARHFLVANSPDVGRAYGNPLTNPPFAATAAPFSEAQRALLTGLTIELNEALEDVLANLSVVSLFTLDADSSFDDVIDAPEAYGFSAGAVDSTGAYPISCLSDPVCAADPQGLVADGFLIFDSVHPTTALHRLIAQNALSVVTPEPATGLYLGLGLAGLAWRRRR